MPTYLLTRAELSYANEALILNLVENSKPSFILEFPNSLASV